MTMKVIMAKVGAAVQRPAVTGGWIERPQPWKLNRRAAHSCTPFIVAYQLEKDEVRILGVMHAARKWPDEF
jgi:plasmid stabilization system protein ParE